MPTKRKAEPPRAWSYSAWKMYDECPLRFKLVRIDRRPTTRGPALERGEAIHKEGEAYLLGNVRGVPKSFKLFAAELRALRRVKASPEGLWAFDRDWQPVGWYDPTVWVRTKLDACYTRKRTAHVVDYKTGKIYEGYGQQLSLYALAAFATFPDATVVEPALWFLDQGEIVGGTSATYSLPDVPSYYERGQVSTLRRSWEARVRPLFADRSFVPRPGPYCRYCDFAATRGGPCRY